MSDLPQQLTLNITGILGQPDTVNVYFLVRKGQALLVDSGRDAEVDGARILQFWRDLGEPRMQGILLTHAHPDHSAAAHELRDYWQVPISLHAADQELLAEYANGVTPDVLLEDGDEIVTPIGLMNVVHTPGHAPGHACFYRAADRLLISGDQVLTNGTTYVGEPHGNMTEHLESLRHLLKLRVGILAPGHGPLTDSGHERILELHEYRLRREGEIIMGLRSGLKNATEIAELLYSKGDLHEAVLQLGINQTQCHLEHLNRIGVIEQHEGSRWELS